MTDFSRVVSSGLNFAGYDQGIDFTGIGQVYAVDPGVIVRIERGTFHFIQGVGSIISYRLDAGGTVYVMEAIQITPGLAVGDRVAAGEILGNVDSSFPGIEMGWATATGSPLYPLGTTTGGIDFAAFIGAGGSAAPPPVTAPPGVTGPQNAGKVSVHQFEQAWAGLMRQLAIKAPAELRRSRAGRARLRKAVR